MESQSSTTASSSCHCQETDTDDTSTMADTWSVVSESSLAVTSPIGSSSVQRYVLRAFTYLHVQDQDTGVTRLVTGQCSFSTKPSERVIFGPQPMVVVPPAHYCVVENPAVRNGTQVAFDEFGQALLRHGEREMRLTRAPFPLFPGETLVGGVRPLPVVGEGQVLRLRALRDTTDSEGTQRQAGDQWLVRKKGMYTPSMAEEVVGVLDLKVVTLTNRQYCIVCTPVLGEKPKRRVVRGPLSFLLQPDETLDNGVREIHFLEAADALDLVAREAFTDETVTPAVERALGDRWTVRGPAVVAPPAEVEVLRKHSVIALGATEGVYVQNTETGEVRAQMGRPYLLAVNERLWSKDLPLDAEQLLAEYRAEAEADGGGGGRWRDKSRVVQVFVRLDRCLVIENPLTEETREVHGPQLASLMPDEQFRVFSLPGGTPVLPGRSQSLTLPLLGDMHRLTDLITVRDEEDGHTMTVNITWKLVYPTSGPIAKNGADEAYLQLRRRFLSEAPCGLIRKLYEIGEFRFQVVVTSDVTESASEY
ncbi:major vault protein-like [Amphibalanus amphitrite]|nr:major vault protein-like [Amphibalanus amphitrite]